MTRSAPLVLPAPAKINLFLHVLGRRPDGYHELQTVFQFLELQDTLTFIPAARPGIELSGAPAGLDGADNLVLRAAHLLAERCGPVGGVHIHLEKRIPVGGGLGGGSSDAATTLRGLDRLWGLELPPADLLAFGRQLGADVPVFLFGRAAWAEGTGEKLTALALPEPWYLVIHPGEPVSTGHIFGAAQLTRSTPATKIAAFPGPGFKNDCESVVCDQYPAVARALAWLRERAPAKLTGTGSCVFAELSSSEEGERLLSEMPAEWQGFVTKGRSTSPLREALGEEGNLGKE